MTTWGGIAGIALSHLLGREYDSTPPEWGGSSSPVETETLQVVLLLLSLFQCGYRRECMSTARSHAASVTETDFNGSVSVH